MRITIYAEDMTDWPPWGPGGLLPDEALPLSAALGRQLLAWLNAYDDRRSEVPAWVPPPGTAPDSEEEAWVEEGERLRALLQAELGSGYEVVLGV